MTEKISDQPPRSKPLQRLHRWLGLVSLLFVLTLSVTGAALNHTDALNLASRFVTADWVLDWYGVDAPDPIASYALSANRVTLLGTRLYIDDRESARNIDALIGAADFNDYIVAVTSDELLVLNREAELVDRVALGPAVTGHPESLSMHGNRLIVGTLSDSFDYDWEKATGMVDDFMKGYDLPG